MTTDKQAQAVALAPDEVDAAIIDALKTAEFKAIRSLIPFALELRPFAKAIIAAERQRLVAKSDVMPRVALWHDPETGHWKKLTRPDRPTYEPYCSEQEVLESIASLQAQKVALKEELEILKGAWPTKAQALQSEARGREVQSFDYYFKESEMEKYLNKKGINGVKAAHTAIEYEKRKAAMKKEIGE